MPQSAHERKRKEPKEPKKAKVPKKDMGSAPRAKSAYMFYRMEKHRALSKSDKTVTFSQAATRIGASWKALTEEELEPYQEMARKDRIRLDQLALAEREAPVCYAAVTVSYVPPSALHTPTLSRCRRMEVRVVVVVRFRSSPHLTD